MTNFKRQIPNDEFRTNDEYAFFLLFDSIANVPMDWMILTFGSTDGSGRRRRGAVAAQARVAVGAQQAQPECETHGGPARVVCLAVSH